MRALGLLILLAQIACAVHVVRTGRSYLWIFLIVFVPVIGIAVYLVAEILPAMAGSRGARQAASGFGRMLDPGRDLREAQRQAAISPTVQNKAVLAEEYLRAGQPQPAAALYHEALTGIHATDPGLMLGLARAQFAAADIASARSTLEALRRANPDYQLYEEIRQAIDYGPRQIYR